MGFKVGGTTIIDNSGEICHVGNIDGRDIAADGAKLDGIEAGATNTAAPHYTSAIGSSDVTTARVYAIWTRRNSAI